MQNNERSRPRWQNSPLVVYGLTGLCIATIVHLGTYLGTSIQPTNPFFFVLHLAVFPLFFVFIFRARRWQGKRSLFSRSEPSHWRELLQYFPPWAIPISVALFAYTFLNFALSAQHLPNHASTLTTSESLYLVRAFSGHWLLFYGLPTIYLGFVPANARPSTGKDRAEVAV
jgi:hypothetical protein